MLIRHSLTLLWMVDTVRYRFEFETLHSYHDGTRHRQRDRHKRSSRSINAQDQDQGRRTGLEVDGSHCVGGDRRR